MTYKQTFWRTLAAVAAMLLTLPATVWAESTFGGGSGTQIDPYKIETPQHLRQLAADVNNGNKYEGKYFIMVSSFSCWIEPFTPIGGKYYTEGSGSNQSTGSRQFCGNFNGNGKTISDLYIRPTEDFYAIGLFGELGSGAHVSNLTIASSQITTTIMGWGNCGAIAGAVNNGANIYNCHVKEGVVVSVDPDDLAQNVQINREFGGIVGENMGTIHSCTSMATVTNADIDGVNTLGGIVGNNLGQVWSCVSLATVTGSNKVGGIAGEKSGAYEFDRSYYHSSPAIGAVNGTDVEGATWMGTISFSGGLSAGVIATPVHSYNSVNYYKEGCTCSIGSYYRIDGGYIPVDPQLTSEQVEIDDNNSFTIPAGQDVVIGCTYSSLKRDIAYSPWVSIDIPSQKYTGEPLTPVITVTDNITGQPVVLSEGVDYSVTLPEGDMINAGNYAIQIDGIGDFAGRATATFVIDPLRWFGEGTEASPYQISTVDDWLLLADEAQNEDFAGTHFILMNDLDFSGVTFKMAGDGQPVQYRPRTFRGCFDGNGRTIDNVTSENANIYGYAGIFGLVGSGGVIKNLISGGGNIFTGTMCVGGIAGELQSGEIINCTSYATVVAAKTSSLDGRYAGGIVGFANGNVKDCRNYGSVTASRNAGGIVGRSQFGSITNSLNFAQVTADEGSGGILGSHSYTSISNNYYAGDCNTGGINGTDVKSEAMRGLTITTDTEDIFVQQFPLDDEVGNFVGITYDGIFYAGAGETTRVLIGRSEDAPAGPFIVNAGTLTPQPTDEYYGDDVQFYLLTMPEPGQDVVISIEATVIPGDVNGDGTLDIGDVVALANHVMGDTPQHFVLDATDINGNGDVDVADVVELASRVQGN